jgi:hypothetical protein
LSPPLKKIQVHCFFLYLTFLVCFWALPVFFACKVE